MAPCFQRTSEERKTLAGERLIDLNETVHRSLMLLVLLASAAMICGRDSLSQSPEKIRAFFNSSTYKAKHRTDAEFITDLYREILQRDPDEPGYKGWLDTLKKHSDDAEAREKAVEAFLKCPEYLGKHSAAAVVVAKNDTGRIPGNILFDKTGVLVNDANALPPDRYAPLLKRGAVVWVALQIDNTGNIRTDNVSAIERGWADRWREAGFKVGFWGCPRGVTKHNDEAVMAESARLVETDAALGVRLTVQCKGEFYIADCEDGYQGYNPKDPAPLLNKVYVDAFESAAKAAGLAKMPRALSSMGRVALDMRPWIEAGWDAMPQAYWNSYAVYQPSKCVDFYVNDTGWPIGRVHPTIATYTGEGENRTVTLQDYATDLKTRSTRGFSFYLPESYLGLKNDSAYDQLAIMGRY